jgi:hypothetical protein
MCPLTSGSQLTARWITIGVSNDIHWMFGGSIV